MTDGNGQTKIEAAPEEKSRATARIDKGILLVEVPLFIRDGEFMAYGMLHKASQMVDQFFRHVEKEAQGEGLGRRILTPAGIDIPRNA